MYYMQNSEVCRTSVSGMYVSTEVIINLVTGHYRNFPLKSLEMPRHRSQTATVSYAADTDRGLFGRRLVDVERYKGLRAQCSLYSRMVVIAADWYIYYFISGRRPRGSSYKERHIIVVRPSQNHRNRISYKWVYNIPTITLGIHFTDNRRDIVLYLFVSS